MAASLTASMIVLCGAAAARADEPRIHAKEIATRGDAEFYAGRCDRAIPLWKQAEARYHAPTILLRIARCEVILGHVVAAAAMLDAIGRETIEPDAPPAFFMARDQARREVAAVRARIATLEITVDARDRSPVAIDVDGAAQCPRDAKCGEGARAIEVDPGERSLRVRAGASSWQGVVKLRDGERVAMRLSLGAEPEPRSPRVLRGLGISAIAIGGASAAVGLGLAIGASSADSPRPLNTAAQVTLATGALLAIGGAVTILVAPARSDAWRVRFGATSIALEKRF